MSKRFTTAFLPFLRQGLAAHGNGGEKAVNVTLTQAGAEGSTPSKLKAMSFPLVQPHDVIGIAGGALREAPFAAVFPPPGSTDNTYDIFPFLEFEDADFLWRYSYGPVTDKSKPRLSPWLVLVVLRRDQYELCDELLSDKDPKIRCVRPKVDPEGFGKLLRALRESVWAYAHVQISDHVETDPVPLEQQLRSEKSSAIFSRLLCPVFLEPSTAYSALVLPADESWWDKNGREGRQLGYPVFYSWDFSTGSDPGFESLFNRIRERKPPSCFLRVQGSDYLDVGAAAQEPAGDGFSMHGALMPLGTVDEPAASPTSGQLRACYEKYLESAKLQKGCALCSFVTDLSDPQEECSGALGHEHKSAPLKELDPYVGVPIYGSYHASGVAAPDEGPGAAGLPWIYETNVATRRRIAAGLGAEVVRRNQEELVDYCWSHREEIQRQDEEARKAEIGRIVNHGAWRKHFATDPLIAPRVAPALPADSVAAALYQGRADQGALIQGALSPAVRKIFHQKGTCRKRLPLEADQDYLTFLAARMGAPAQPAAPGPARAPIYATKRTVFRSMRGGDGVVILVILSLGLYLIRFAGRSLMPHSSGCDSA